MAHVSVATTLQFLKAQYQNLVSRTRYIEALGDNDAQQADDSTHGSLQVQMQRPPDGLSSLLFLLEAIYGIYPALGADNSLR